MQGGTAMSTPCTQTMSTSSMTKLERIGKGSYGEVFKARIHSSGIIVVVKEVSLLGITPEEEKELLNESQVMVQVHHKHVVRFMASFVEHSMLHIVMEWASGGDLAALIRSHALNAKMIEEEVLWTYLIQLAEGLQHLHSRRILHRDMKASNVFLDSQGCIKIGDLGLGKILTGTVQCAMSQVGTPLYFSPEICEGRPYDTKSDVWALGCLMHELATLRPPFHAHNQIALAKKIVHDQPDVKISSKYSHELHFIIGKMLSKNPRDRPSSNTLLRYSAIQIRMDRARFQERELELLRMVDAERSKQQAGEVKVAELLERLKLMEDAKQAEDKRHASQLEALNGQLFETQSRCDALKAENTELVLANGEKDKIINSHKIKLEDLERWEKDLAQRELQVLQSEASKQEHDDRDLCGEYSAPKAQHTPLQHRSLQTPMEPASAHRRPTSAAPTPADLFPTVPTSDARRRALPCTPQRSCTSDMSAASPYEARRQSTPIVDGYIRARARTPQTSLGPPKRVLATSEASSPSNDADDESKKQESKEVENFGEAPPPVYIDEPHGIHWTWTSGQHQRPPLEPMGRSHDSLSALKSARKPVLSSITNLHTASRACKGISTETSERIVAHSLANNHVQSSRGGTPHSSQTYEGCSPEVEYILAYTDRMRQVAQQALSASCATSSSSGSDKSVRDGSSRSPVDESNSAKPRRKLTFAEGRGVAVETERGQVGVAE